MRKILVLCIFYLAVSICYCQDNSFGLKSGFVYSNAYVPDYNGEVTFYSNGLVGTDENSFEYKPGYLVGLSKRFPVPFERGKFIYLTGQFAKYGFKADDIEVELNYIEADINILGHFGNNERWRIALGGGPSYLLSENGKLDNVNKFDLRMGMIFGYGILDNMNILAQGKLGLLNLNDAKAKNYMLSLILEYMIF